MLDAFTIHMICKFTNYKLYNFCIKFTNDLIILIIILSTIIDGVLLKFF